jgi:hypothetical protein
MIVDCGGYTVDLATYKLIGDVPLQSGHIRDFCGSTFIDKEFIKFLREKLDSHAINLLLEVKHNEYKELIKSFWIIKESFTEGNIKLKRSLRILQHAPSLSNYVSKKTRKIMEETSWEIVIEYNDIKKMFDPIIDRIIRLIKIQLSNSQEICSAIFLVGGLSRNKYLQKMIKEEFRDMIISVPDQPMCVIANGAVIYGLSFTSNLNKLKSKASHSSKVLKYTYGIQLNPDWSEHVDHPNTSNRETYKFNPLVKQETEVKSDQIFSFDFKPEPGQIHVKFVVYYTNNDSVTYVDELGTKTLGILNVDLPGKNCFLKFEISYVIKYN